MPNAVWIYLAAVNLLALFLTVWDKRQARRHAWRVPERTLFLVALLGGAPLMLAGMCAVRHKTRKAKFMLGLPLIFLLQAAAAYCIFFR